MSVVAVLWAPGSHEAIAPDCDVSAVVGTSVTVDDAMVGTVTACWVEDGRVLGRMEFHDADLESWLLR